MQLAKEEIEHFRREGWLAVPGLWNSEEVDAMRAELDRLKRIGKLRNVATDGDGMTESTQAQNLQLCPLAPDSELFATMAHAPQAVEVVSQLIGAPNVLHLDQVFLKPGRHGSGTSWHQDNAYFQIGDPLHGTAMWTAVHDATVANGTLRVIPRAFHEQLGHDRDPMSDHHIRCWPDESRSLPVEVEAGSAIFFCYGTPHATGANTTNAERAGVALHFIHERELDTARGGYVQGPRKHVALADGSPARPDLGARWAELVAA